MADSTERTNRVIAFNINVVKAAKVKRLIFNHKYDTTVRSQTE